MNLYDLIAEGEAMSKVCFEITSAQAVGDVVGYWDDETGNRGDPTLILSEALFADPVLKLFPYQSLKPLRLRHFHDEDEEFDDSLEFLSVPFAQIKPHGQPLYAIEAPSFPLLQQVVRYGSDEIKTWAKTQGKHFPDDYAPHSVADKYMDEYQSRNILYRDAPDVDLVVGGWSFVGWNAAAWPSWTEDGPSAERVHLFTTLRDAEPWYEAWYEVALNRLHLKWIVT
jgi:hypothetical protein